MAGHSGTPLAKKLGIRDGGRVFVASPPPRYQDFLQPMPSGVKMVARLDDSVDVIHFFTASRTKLQKELR